MRKVTAAGQNVDEAVQSGLKELQLTKDQVEITVIDEGSKGFLGIFGKKQALVELTEKLDPVQETKAYLEQVCETIAGPSHVMINESKKTITFQIRVIKLRC